MTNQAPRRALALDFGRVFTLDQNRAPFRPLLSRLGIGDGDFHRAWLDQRLAFDRGDLDARTYWQGVLARCAPDLGASEAARLVPELVEADFASWARPREPFHALVRRALGAGIPTAIVSNMPAGVGDRFVETWPWLSQIPHRFFSADFGEVKPDDAFYLHVLANTGWKAENVLFVDDSPANTEAAGRLGFVPCLFTGSDEDLAAVARWCGLA